MKLRPEEVASIIEKELANFKLGQDLEEVGTLLKIGDSIATIHGLKGAMSGELLSFPNDVTGMVLNLEENSIGAAIFRGGDKLKEGDIVRGTKRIASVPAGEELIGRVVNPLGEPLDGKGAIKTKETRPVEFLAPDVISRSPVKEPLMTGLKAIDSMIPIGKGQRELIIGDRQVGKTAIALDAIINQKGKNVICIYVAIGQKASSIAGVVNVLEKNGAMDYTIVVASDANDSAVIQYIAPYAGCAMGEYFMYKGKHVLCVYDDLSKHATAYRQLSLLLRRPPGREAYPGDVFYCHSRLLERAAKLQEKLGGGSLTALPIIETQAGDVSAYIPTNVISITDGQIYLEPDLFYAGQRPAVNVGISVSRVGGNAQTKAMKKVGGKLRLDLAQYRELAAFAQFGSDLDKSTREKLHIGERMTELLKQTQYAPLSLSEQVVQIAAGVWGYLNDVEVINIATHAAKLLEFISEQYAVILKNIESEKDITKETEELMKKAFIEFNKKVLSKA